jgi:IS30 family transposase
MEITRNSVRKKGSNKTEYLAKEANHKAYVKRHNAKTQSMKINLNTELKLFIISELERKDKITSAKSIAFEWNSKEDKKETISHESIYKWLEQTANDKYRKNLLYKK